MDRDLEIDAVFTYYCFAASTPILTSDGYTAIDELQAGDLILSYDHLLDELVDTAIAFIHSREVTGLMEVELANDTTIQVTKEHPFYDPEESRYKPIGEFAPGDRLVQIGRNGKLEAIVIVGIEAVPGEFTVYNMGVESMNHNYVAAGVLVHNKTPTPSPRPRPTATPTATP